MGIISLLVLMFAVGVVILIGAKISKTDMENKCRLTIIGCVLIFTSLAFAAFLAFILIPSM